MKPIKTLLRLMLITGILLFQNSCKKNEDDTTEPAPPPPATQNDPELITRMEITFTDSAMPANQFTCLYIDPDGQSGSGAPTQVDTIRLFASKTYLLNIKLFNDLATPVDTVSNQIHNEANDHQFFFSFNQINVQAGYRDLDTQTPPQPLGLQAFWRTTAPGPGGAGIVLKHQAGIKDGNIATGIPDLQAGMPCIVQ